MILKQKYQKRNISLSSVVASLFRIGGLLLLVHSIVGITVIICIFNNLAPATPWLWIELKILVYPLALISCSQSLIVICTYHLSGAKMKRSLLILSLGCGAFLCTLNLSAWYAIAAFPFLCITYIAQWIFQARLPSPQQKKSRTQSVAANLQRKKLTSAYRRQHPPSSEMAISLQQTVHVRSIPPQCIIWYDNQADERFARQLLKHLRPLARQGIIQLWDIGTLQPGDLWEAKRSQAIESATVAVLLISADFLNNERVACHELPQILHHTQTHNTLILRLQVSPCDLTGTGLEQFYPINTQDRSLAKLGRAAREEILTQTARSIRQRLGQC